MIIGVAGRVLHRTMWEDAATTLLPALVRSGPRSIATLHLVAGASRVFNQVSCYALDKRPFYSESSKRAHVEDVCRLLANDTGGGRGGRRATQCSLINCIGLCNLSQIEFTKIPHSVHYMTPDQFNAASVAVRVVPSCSCVLCVASALQSCTTGIVVAALVRMRSGSGLTSSQARCRPLRSAWTTSRKVHCHASLSFSGGSPR